ncbi:kinesin-like protein KIF11-B [Neocloeon triangulifer]|uniref:kinesin-like protein KIF11-B n=1 Tax=Neocloeon triangulifer TaxID=2078957 RepID=UPI00286FA3D6|nr:kinesin-like protein KIF11-B [Neocloeon triangulifer]
MSHRDLKTPAKMADNKCGAAASKRENIQVYVRVRPMNEKERMERKNQNVVELKKDREVIVRDRTNLAMTKTFTFDKAFGPNSKQVDVYKAVAQPMISEVLEGYNCTIFAYGQTGTGKTFTMEGERSNDDMTWEKDPLCGLVPRVLSHMFDELRLKNIEFTMAVSYLELYNEELIDLLSPEEDNSKLRLFEDAQSKGSVIVQGLTDVRVLDKKQVYDILSRGSKKRQTAATFMNATSSRSHTIFMVTIHIRESTEAGEDLIRTGKINLVDLAGSENISRSGATNQRAKEAGNINQSLLTLGRVITSLVEKTPHIPYRESKLTRLLQDSLGGKTKTAIVATVSPVLANLEETLSTLDYAHRAKSITNRPQINQRLSKQAFIKEYDQEIERLRKDLIAQRSGAGIYVDPENYKEMETKIERQDVEILEKIQIIRSLEEEREKRESVVQDLSEKLEETTERLERTAANLAITERNLDEKEVLLDYHLNTEENLKVETGKLISVTDETTRDLEKTHDALERTRNLEAKNTQASATFTSKMDSLLKLAKSESVSHCENQQTQISNLERCTSKLEELQMQTITAMRDEFLSLKVDLTAQFQQARQNLVSNGKEIEQLETQIAQAVTLTNEEIVEMVKRNAAEQLEALAAINLRLLQEKLAQHLQTVIESVTSAFEESIQDAKLQADEVSKTWISLEEKNNKLQRDLIGEQTKVRELKAECAEKANKTQVYWSSTTSLIQKLVLEGSSMSLQDFTNLEQQCNAVEENLKTHTGSAAEISQEINRGAQSIASLSSKNMENLMEKYTNVNKTLAKQNREAQGEVAAADSTLALASNLINSQAQEVQISLQNAVSDFKSSSSSKMETLASHISAQDAYLQNAEAAVQTKEQQVAAMAAQKGQELEEQKLVSRQELEMMQQVAVEGREVANGHIDSIRQTAVTFVNSELAKYAPTGATPARQEREYPRQLKFSSPAPRILARHYAELARQQNQGPDSGLNSPSNSNSSTTTGSSDVENRLQEAAVNLVKNLEQSQEPGRRVLGSRNQ